MPTGNENNINGGLFYFNKETGKDGGDGDDS